MYLFSPSQGQATSGCPARVARRVETRHEVAVVSEDLLRAPMRVMIRMFATT